MNDIQIRPYEHTDRDFIYKSWIENYRHSSYVTKRIRDPEYYAGQQRVIDEIMHEKQTHISVAADVNDLSFIHGYIVVDLPNKIVHFCFVRQKLRKAGVARTLFLFSGLSTEQPIYFSHWTDPMDSLVNRKDVRLVYDPYKV